MNSRSEAKQHLIKAFLEQVLLTGTCQLNLWSTLLKNSLVQVNTNNNKMSLLRYYGA